MASNLNPLNLHLLSSCDYRPPHPAPQRHFFNCGKFSSVFIPSISLFTISILNVLHSRNHWPFISVFWMCLSCSLSCYILEWLNWILQLTELLFSCVYSVFSTTVTFLISVITILISRISIFYGSIIAIFVFSMNINYPSKVLNLSKETL
jgi:hypothetical protein